MEEELQVKMKENMRSLKDKLASNQNEIKDLLLERDILPDVDKINKLSTETEKVEMMVLMVINEKKCEQFVNILEKLGYEQLCKEMKESVSVLYSRGKTYVKEESTCSLKRDKEPNQLEGMKVLLQEREEKWENRVTEQAEEWKNRVTEQAEEWKNRVTEQDEEWKKRVTEQDERWEKRDMDMYNAQIATHKEIELQQIKYRHLQESYKNAKERINDMTTHAKEKQYLIVKLEKDIKQIQEMLSGSDSYQEDSNMIQANQNEIAKLEKEIAGQNQEMEIIQEEKRNQEKELIKQKNFIDSLLKDNDSLRMINGMVIKDREGPQKRRNNTNHRNNSPQK